MSLCRLCLVFAYLCLGPSVLAHANKEVLKTYKVAKRHYIASDYVGAKAILEPLLAVEEKNDITPYARFYYALAAYYNQELALAENTFSTILEEYPDWEQKDEVWYWLGQLSFETGNHSEGLARLAEITDKKLAKSLGQMKAYFLQQLDDVATLRMIFEQYPEDQVLASVLFDKVAQQPFISRDLDLLNALAHDFNFSLKECDAFQDVVPLKKDSYNVAVFFPFFVDEVDYEEDNGNQFVIALYQGIKAGVTVLAEQGIKINLFAYDTKKDSATTAALLEQEEVKGMDLIIGPLYAATIPLVAEFARIHQINFFNPLSENMAVVGDNPFAYLFKSSLETQARKAAEFTLRNSGERLNVGIIYGVSKAEAIQAHIYQKCIEDSTGGKVTLMHAISPEEAQSALNALREASEKVGDGKEQEAISSALLDLNSLTHIYVPSKNELIVAYLLNTLETLKQAPCIIGHEAWLRQSSLTLDQLKRLHLYFVAPNHIDYVKEAIYAFRSSFYEQFAQYPTHYACIGYEMTLFLGRMLNQYGVYFQNHWKTQWSPGTIFEEVTYGMHHDNQHVPIVKFQGNQFVVCNKPSLGD